jgi:hypothetical protein
MYAGSCRCKRRLAGSGAGRPARSALSSDRLVCKAHGATLHSFPRALLFDCDGVLVDTEKDGHRVAFNAAFREMALPHEWDVAAYGRLVRSCVSLPALASAVYVINAMLGAIRLTVSPPSAACCRRWQRKDACMVSRARRCRAVPISDCSRRADSRSETNTRPEDCQVPRHDCQWDATPAARRVEACRCAQSQSHCLLSACNVAAEIAGISVSP